MVRHRSLIMLFSDLLAEPEAVIDSLHHLRHRGNDVILFHVLDEAEALFPFDGIVEFEDVESHEKLTVDTAGIRADYLSALQELTARYRRECFSARIDYVLLHTGLPFDRALMSYLVSRQKSF
jgi:hypothetical protein